MNTKDTDELRDNTSHWLQLPQGETVVQIMPYPVEHTAYPKWKFWRNQKIKYNFFVLAASGRMYVVDPDNFTVHEKPNEY